MAPEQLSHRAFGTSLARMRPLTSGTSGSSVLAMIKVGCRRKGSQGRLLQPTTAIEQPWDRLAVRS